MAGMLFVHGGSHLAREVFQREQRGEWSQALPVVLEKWGYLAFDEAGPSALDRDDTFAEWDVVLVARMPDGAWTREVVERIRSGRAQVLAEGPLPEPVLTVLGVASEGSVAMVGGIVVSDPELHAAAREFGVAPGAALAPADRHPATVAVPAGEPAIPHAAAWRRPGWDVERWRLLGGTGAVVYAEWVAPNDVSFRFPAVLRSGNLTACSFGLFAFVSQRHTAEPYDGAERRSSSRSTGLEVMLLALVDRLHRWSDAVRPRVLPWPEGARWAVGRPIGSPAAFHGASTVLAAERAGQRVLDQFEHAHYHPHRFAALEEDGAIRTANIVCLPHPETLPKNRAKRTASLRSIVERWREVGGFLQVDADVSADGDASLLRLTAPAVADWWHRSHRRDRVILRAVGEGRFELATAEPIDGLTLELLHPDGSRIRHVALATDGPQTVASDVRRASLPVTWEETHPVYAEIVGRVFASGAKTGAGVVSSATIANETTATPRRGEFVVDMLRSLAGVELNGRRALDIGCGFGTVSAYIAWRTRPARMLATDVSSRRVDEASEGARRTGLDAVVEYAVHDVSDLADIDDESFDVVLAIGVLMYLERPQLKQALRELHRVLAPEGVLLVYQRNRWQKTEAQTGRRWIHLLPRAVALRIYGNAAPPPKNWVSPVELRRGARRAGFRATRVRGFSKRGPKDRGPRRLFGESFALAARRAPR